MRLILDSLQAIITYYGHTYDREYLQKYVILHSVHQFLREFAQREGLQFKMVYQYYTILQDAGNDKVSSPDHLCDTYRIKFSRDNVLCKYFFHSCFVNGLL